MNRRPNLIPAGVLIGLGPLLLVCGIYGLPQPDEFRASARIKIALDIPDTGLLVESNTSPAQLPRVLDKYYPEVMQYIIADPVLSNVLSQLNLSAANDNRRKLETPRTIPALRNQLSVKAVRNTLLVDIYATDVSADDAAQIANLVATAYQQWWWARTESLFKAGIAELEKELTIQKQKVRNSETELQHLKVELNLPSPEPTKDEIRTRYPKIYDAERLLEDERDVERLLTRKINIEKAGLSSHPTANVEIVERAIPPRSPIRHKKTLSLTLIASGLLCCGWGIKLVRDSGSTENEA